VVELPLRDVVLAVPLVVLVVLELEVLPVGMVEFPPVPGGKTT
jgi:hypothetical protein